MAIFARFGKCFSVLSAKKGGADQRNHVSAITVKNRNRGGRLRAEGVGKEPLHIGLAVEQFLSDLRRTRTVAALPPFIERAGVYVDDAGDIVNVK